MGCQNWIWGRERWETGKGKVKDLWGPLSLLKGQQERITEENVPFPRIHYGPMTGMMK